MTRNNPLIVDQSNPYDGSLETSNNNTNESNGINNINNNRSPSKGGKDVIALNDYKINILKHLSESNLAPSTPTLLKVKPISMKTQMNSKMYRQDAQELMNLVSDQKSSDPNIYVIKQFASGNLDRPKKLPKKRQAKSKNNERSA